MLFSSPLARRVLFTALSLNLVSLTGCAAPTVPTASTTPSEASAPAAAQPGALGAEPPASAPAVVPAIVAGLPLMGKVTFGGAALAGYALTAVDPLTGAALTVNGLAVTDAAGSFNVQVAGVKAGQPVRLVASHGVVRLEATVLASDAPVLLSEGSTTLSHVQAGPLQVAGLLSAEAAAPVAEAYMKAVNELSLPFATQLVSLNQAAGAIARVPSNAKEQADFEAAIETVVANTGRATALTDATLALVSAVGAAPHANQFATFSVQAPTWSYVRFLGTVLKAGVGGEGGGLQVANVRTGRMVDARDAGPGGFKAVAYVKKSTPKRQTFTGPFTPQFLSKYTDVTKGVPVFAWVPTSDATPGGIDTLRLAMGCFTSGVNNGRAYVDFNLLEAPAARAYVAQAIEALESASALTKEQTLIKFQGTDRPFSRKIRFYITQTGEIASVEHSADFGGVNGSPLHAHDPMDKLLLDAIPAYVFSYDVPALQYLDNGDLYGDSPVPVKAGFGIDDDGILAMIDGLGEVLRAAGVSSEDTVPFFFFAPEQECPLRTDLQRELKHGVAMRTDYIVQVLAGGANGNLQTVATWLDFKAFPTTDADAEGDGDASSEVDESSGAESGGEDN